YGVGRELSRPEWSSIGRELLRMGLLEQEKGGFPTIALTEAGLETLRSRRVVMLTKPMETRRAPKARAGEIACDETLFDRLRKLRKRLADERGVPAYVIFGDTTLRQMAREYPESPDALRAISGIGEKKLQEFGAAFADEVRDYLRTYPKGNFRDP
ncbi:MAG: HRDC domain-containing protein, partial [Verrucomicrobiae bacterium]